MIYFDYNATTSVHPKVKKYMFQLMDYPVNASSVHSFGRKARKIVENSKIEIATMLGIVDRVKDYNIVFTSGATEANNLILSNFSDGDIFISSIEHDSIYNIANLCRNSVLIKNDSNGILDLEDLRHRLVSSKAKKKLVSVMLANNETGVIQDIKEIAKVTHEAGGLIHSDIVQAPGKIDVNLVDLDVDFVSISSHKFRGPGGIGALIFKEGLNNLKPIILGGSQQKGMRAGTENVVAIAGFGLAAKIATEELPFRSSKMAKLRDYFENALLSEYQHIKIASSNVARIPNTSLIINPLSKAENQLIIFDLHGISLSSGSACSSGKVGESKVLLNMGYSKQDRECAIRVSIGENNSEKEIDFLIDTYKKINQLKFKSQEIC